MPGTNPYSTNPDFGIGSGEDAYQDVAAQGQAAQANSSRLSGMSGFFGPVLSFIEGFINRRFNSQEAEKARQWQEDMYQKYQSPSAMRSQFEEAGLNPYLVYGNANAAGSMPTASVGAHSDSRVDYNQMAVHQANARLLGAEASNQEVENLYQEQEIAKRFDEMSAHAKLMFAQSRVEDTQSKILLNELDHWLEDFSNRQKNVLAQTDEAYNRNTYRDASLGIERIRTALDGWYKFATVSIEKERNSEIRNQNMRYMQYLYNQLVENLNQADRHFKDAKTFQGEQNKENRTLGYVQTAENLVADVARIVSSYYLYGNRGLPVGMQTNVPGMNQVQGVGSKSKSKYTRNDDGSYNWHREDGSTWRVSADAVPDKYR